MQRTLSQPVFATTTTFGAGDWCVFDNTTSTTDLHAVRVSDERDRVDRSNVTARIGHRDRVDRSS